MINLEVHLMAKIFNRMYRKEKENFFVVNQEKRFEVNCYGSQMYIKELKRDNNRQINYYKEVASRKFGGSK